MIILYNIFYEIYDDILSARVVPNCPKPERVAREGVSKESVENMLAASAARIQQGEVSGVSHKF